MRELMASREMVRQEQLRAMVNHLHRQGVDATLAEESATDRWGRGTTETIVQLKGQNIDKIRLLSNEYGGYGTDSGARFQYELLLDRALSHELKKAIETKTRSTKENKLLGLFGGKVVDIIWVGGDIAERLNQDEELSGQLLECARCAGNVELQIRVLSPSVIEILGPRFLGPSPLLRLEMHPEDADACYKIFEFKFYSKIVKHVTTVLAD